MIEYVGRVKNGVVVFDPPAPALEGRCVRVLELEGDPIDDADRSFWEEKSIDELAAEQSVPVIKKLEEVMGGWPEEERDDGFEEEFRRWRSGGAAENR